jgi:hypothetical protein
MPLDALQLAPTAYPYTVTVLLEGTAALARQVTIAASDVVVTLGPVYQADQLTAGSAVVSWSEGAVTGGNLPVPPDIADELARLQGQRAAVAQQIAHATVGGGLHSHFDPMGRGSVHGALRRVSRLINFLEIDDKSLIFQCFVRCSDFLWITLLKTRGDARQTLENQAFRHNAHLLSRN